MKTHSNQKSKNLPSPPTSPVIVVKSRSDGKFDLEDKTHKPISGFTIIKHPDESSDSPHFILKKTPKTPSETPHIISIRRNGNPASKPVIDIRKIRHSKDPNIREMARLIENKDRAGLISFTEKLTGIKIHDIGNSRFETELSLVLAQLYNKRGFIPPDVKHFVIGHGIGKIENGNWRFLKKNVGVFDYINANIKKGEKAFVVACQDGKPMNFGLCSTITNAHGQHFSPYIIIKSGKSHVDSYIDLQI